MSSTIKRRVASRMAAVGVVHPHLGGGTLGGDAPAPSLKPLAAPITTPDPANDPKPVDVKDSIYQSEIGGLVNTRGALAAQLKTAFTNNTANDQTTANKGGLVGSSTLANQLADLSQGYTNDTTQLNTEYGNPNVSGDYGTRGLGFLGEAQQRHASDPSPFVLDNPGLSAATGGKQGQPTSSVKLGSGWRLLYDASGKPVRFLRPGETWNGI